MQKRVVLCCSYPKSGRTWIRYIVANYLNQVHDLNFEINFNNIFQFCPNNGPDPQRGLPAYRFQQRPDIPLLLFDHNVFHPNYQQATIIFVVRGLHDTLVSKYFQDTQRIKCFQGTISDYLRSQHGVSRLIHYLNSWAQHLQQSDSVVVSYEKMHQNIHLEMENVIQKLTGKSPDQQALLWAISQSTFSKMKKVEIESGFPNQQLQIDANNNNALRARKGKVNAFDEYLQPSDIEFINQYAEAHLNPKSQQLIEQYCLFDE